MRRRFIAIAVVFLAVCVAASYFVFFDVVYKDKIFPGVKIGILNFSGFDKDSAEKIIQEIEYQIDEFGLRLVFFGEDGIERKLQILPTLFTSETDDATLELLRIDSQKTLSSLFGVGREGDFFTQLKERLGALLFGKNVFAAIDIDRKRLLDTIELNVEPFTRPPQNAHLVFDDLKTFNARLVPEQNGSVLQVNAAVDTLLDNLKSLSLATVQVERIVSAPPITASRAGDIFQKLPEVLYKKDILLAYGDLKWTLKPQTFAPWLEFQEADGGIVLGFNKELVFAYLKKEVAPKVNVAVQDARFSLAGGRVVEFIASRPGKALDEEKTYESLNKIISSYGAEGKMELVVNTQAPKLQTGDTNELGISELLGVGVSSYKGSPVNRVKNIKNGVKKLNGILIAPGEEFSLLKPLRPFTLEGGYLPELVIKGDKIIPEIGGGLCQIGTTMFRSAMNAGLEIKERRNHGLVVRYYNDPSNNNPGTDATIYDPSPDFKFVNDYDKHILLTTEMDEVKKELRFSLWGTTDGRRGYYSAPVVSAWRPAGPKKIIKTTELAPGKLDCKEAHPGASASFVYSIELPDGTKKERVFASNYRSLPEICMLGVTEEELAQDLTGGQTEDIINVEG